jgi:hypothetical protein
MTAILDGYRTQFYQWTYQKPSKPNLVSFGSIVSEKTLKRWTKKFTEKIELYVELLIVMQLQFKFELILT